MHHLLVCQHTPLPICLHCCPAGMVPPDATTIDYVTQRTDAPFEAVYADEQASYQQTYRRAANCCNAASSAVLSLCDCKPATLAALPEHLPRMCFASGSHPCRIYCLSSLRAFCACRFDVSKLEPVVAAPHSPDNRKLARECSHVKIDRVYIGCASISLYALMCSCRMHWLLCDVKVCFLLPQLRPAPQQRCTALQHQFCSEVCISSCSCCSVPVPLLAAMYCVWLQQHEHSRGPLSSHSLNCFVGHACRSCTGGKYEDFAAAAKLLHKAGGQVKVPTYLVPATQKVYFDVFGLPVPGCEGKTAAQIFQEAGCDTPASPSCAACLGGPQDTYARMNKPEVCVSTTNR